MRACYFPRSVAFATLPQVSEEIIQELTAIRKEFPTPEDINDDPNTEPSKRIEQIFADYDKPTDGPLIAQEIGLAAIRAQCPRFNAWVARLESLGNPSPLPYTVRPR